jgi:hypothetical protein
LLAVGLDGDDGHRRVTQSEDALVVGGSEDTHESMQEAVIKLNEALQRRGKRIRGTPADELRDLIREIQM